MASPPGFVGNPKGGPLMVKGNKLGGGRPKGSRHKLSESFLKALVTDFNRLTSDGTGEKLGAKAIRRAREEDPVAYMKCIASLQPKDLNVTVSPLETTDDTELRHQLDAIESEIRALIGGTITIENGVSAPLENTETPALPALLEADGISRGRFN